jgi:N-carbamoylputrescine amidase
MKAALVVPEICADASKNFAKIERMAAESVALGADFILLPEAVLTGLSNNDDPAHDLPLGQTVPGPATERLGAFCARHGVWLGFGLLEREDRRMYDSAVLLGPDGRVRLKYRRNHSHWHARNADPEVYCQGTEIPKAKTPFGSMGFLICGDIFDDGIVSRFRDLRADWLLFCLARSHDGSIEQWEAEELPAYAARVKLTQTPALMVNYLADDSLVDDGNIGGAYYFSAKGEIVECLPPYSEGILLMETALGRNDARAIRL